MASTPSGATIFTTPCTPSSPARRNGYYADFGSLADLAKALRQAFVRDGSHSRHRRCRHGRPPVGLSGDRFLACLQNHDQIGNRAQGERSSQLMSLGRLKIGAALVLTSPFVPLLVSGGGMGRAHSVPILCRSPGARACRSRARGTPARIRRLRLEARGHSRPGLADTFQRSKLDWSEMLSEPHRGLLHWHRQLIHLRRAEPELFAGPLEGVSVRFDEQARWLTLARGHISVACNFGSGPQVVPLGAGPYQTLLASDPRVEIGLSAVTLAPDSVVILKN